MTGVIPLPYKLRPRSYQWRVIKAWQRGIRKFCLIMHRRAGKTELLLALKPMQMLRQAGTYPHVFPRLKQAREVVWKGVNRAGMPYLRHFPPELMLGKPNQAEMSISQMHPHGFSRYVLLGTDRNIDSLIGMNSPHIDWDEWSLQNPRARTLAAPILDENGGSECVIFTVRGKNHGHGLYQSVKNDPDWHTEFLTVDDTRRDGPGEDGSPVITQETIEKRRREEREPTPDIDAIIEQEYYNNWETPRPGAYYGKQLREAEAEGRICDLPWDRTRRVHTVSDFGESAVHETNTWWFFQMVGQWVHWIDYYQASNEGVGHFVKMLLGKPYAYGSHFAMEGDLDKPDLAEGKTRQWHFSQLNIEFTPVPKLPISDGLNAMWLVLPRSRFDRTKCDKGLEALRDYHREWNEEKRMWESHPVHDWSSHAADGARYGAVAIIELEDTPWQHNERPMQPARGTDFDPMRRW